MAILERTADMKPPLGFNVCGVREFGGGVNAYVDFHGAVNGYLSHPLIPVWRYAKKSAGTAVSWLASVLIVDRARRDAQIQKPVVASNTVDVVNMLWRPFAMNVEPRKTMAFVVRTINGCDRISVLNNSASLFPNKARMTPTDSPRKNAGVWIVMEQFAQAFCANIVGCHDALLKLIGQRPAAIHSRLSASLF